MSTPVSIAALIIAVVVAYAAGQTDKNALIIKPARVEADKAFDLEVLSFRWNCGATYSHIESRRDGSRLAVRFAVTGNPAAICPAIEKPYGPTIRVSDLPAGRYDVWATPLLPCQVAPKPCEVPEKEEHAGILTVGKVADTPWFIQPVTVPANQDFDLRILSEKYGNCQTRFEHVDHVVDNERITVSFVIKTDTTLVCIVDIHPHGPALQVQGLKAGKYPVDVIETPECIYGKPACPWLPPDRGTRTLDTLTVTGSSAVQNRSAGAGYRAAWAGRTLSVTSPDGAIPAQGDLIAPDGRRLAVLELRPAGAGRKEAWPLPKGLPAGLLFLRLRLEEGPHVLLLGLGP